MVNEEIRDREVRLIDEEGNQVGIVPVEQAQNLAFDKNLDLVKVSPNAKPPVCRIMDYGKYRYEQQRKEREARKNQRTIQVKELRLSPNTDTHDVNIRVRQAQGFLKDGDKVKVSVRFRGRELGHTDMANDIFDAFVEGTSELGVVDKKPKMEGRSMVMFLAPKN